MQESLDRRESLALLGSRAVKDRRETLEVTERMDYRVLEVLWVNREYPETLEPKDRQGCRDSWERRE